MTENLKLGEMDYESRSCESEEEKGTQKICMANQISRLQHTNIKSDSFLVDMESFSHSINKDVSSPNSRITLQRSLTRKGSQREGEKRINLGIENQTENSVVVTSSPRVGASTPEKPMVVTMGPTNYAINPQIHHHITITTGNTSTDAAAAAAAAAATESKLAGRRMSFKRSSPSRTIDPRRILFFFATLSSMGSILLIYLTLSMGKLKGDDNAFNW